MEEGGPSFGKNFFRNLPARDSFFLKLKNRHIGVIPHHHTIMGTKGEVHGRCRKSVEVGGGDLGGGRVRGELARFVLKFPLFWVFPHNFLIRAKMHKSKKETKGRRQHPTLTHPV